MKIRISSISLSLSDAIFIKWRDLMTIHAKWKAWPNQVRRRALTSVDGRRRASTRVDVDALGVNGPLASSLAGNLITLSAISASERGVRGRTYM